ncbi:MAG: CHASE2 domain-containing protein [Sphingomonas sp.]
MNLLADSYRPRPGARSILFLDFDDETSRRLGDPVLVPANATGRALARIAPMKPWAVFVDLDLASVEDPDDIAGLRNGISELIRSGAVVLLGRETIPASENSSEVRLRPSKLDRFVADTNGVLWVSVAYSAGDDGIVRTILPVQTVQAEARLLVLPSMPLVLKLLAMDGNSQRLEQMVELGITNRSNCAASDPAMLSFCTATGVFQIDPRSPVTVDYSFRWRRAPASHYRIANSLGSAPQIMRVPMYPLLANAELDPSLFRNALVIVGATAERRDIRATPIDTMPGAFILANAARDWLELGPHRSSYVTGLVLILCATLLLTILTWLLLSSMPKKWSRRLRGKLAAILTAVLWLLFLALGNPVASIGLILTAFLVVSAVCFCHELGERLKLPAERHG